LATRGSPLALTQTHLVLAQCRAAFPEWRFEIKIIKTTGDKLQRASMAQPAPQLPKGLFTKELEEALLRDEADLAVHSLKDLPTELPAGLRLGAVGARADVRDVLVYRGASAAAHTSDSGAEAGAAPRPAGGDHQTKRGFPPHLRVEQLPPGATLATSSTRRKEQLLALRPDLRIVEIRGNVGTRLRKLAENPELDGTLLAAAGLARLGFQVTAEGRLLAGPAQEAPPGLLASFLEPEVMLPCVGQAAVAIEIRSEDARAQQLCDQLNHHETSRCVAAERSFLRAMGGGCQSPVAAYADVRGGVLRVRAVSFRSGARRQGELRGRLGEAESLGEQLARALQPKTGSTG
jgi:hydroxymethylbilane synthase